MRIFVQPTFKTPAARSVQDWLSGAGSVSPLMQTAQQLASLEAQMRSLLPPGLANGVMAGRIRHDTPDGKETTLVLLAAHSAAATRARQAVPALLERLRRQGSQITAIRIRVQPQGGSDDPWSSAMEKPPKRARMTAAGLNSLTALAASLPDSPLQRALSELVARHTPAP